MGLLKDLKSKIWEDGCDVAENTLDAVLDSTLRYLELDAFVNADLIRVRGDMDAKFAIGDGECKASVLVTDSDSNIINLNHLKDTGVVVIGVRDAEKRKDREKGNGEHPGQMRLDEVQSDEGDLADAVAGELAGVIDDPTYEPLDDDTPVEVAPAGKKPVKTTVAGLAGKRKRK